MRISRFILHALIWLMAGWASVGQETAKVVDTLDQLLARAPSKLGTWKALGGSSTNDGRGGEFWYDPSATTSTNLGMVFKPTNASGRYFRIWNGEPIDIQWFGAKPTKDSGGLTPAGTFDNAPKINAAINFARTPTYGPTDVRASVFIPAGDWWISTPITNRYRVDVFGLGCVFTDNEVTSHGATSSGLVAGASRIRLADGANCPMMVWDLSDASQRYTFAYTDDGLSIAATMTIASPGVITSTNHGLTIGRRVGFTTSGSLPTGISASTIYYVASVPTADTLTISATSGGAAINTSGSQSGTHLLVKDPTAKYVAGNTIRGINFFGNSVNQTRSDCHIIKIEYAWNIRLDNCNFGNPNGYAVFAYDCNTLDIVDCYANGGRVQNKGVFLHSCADGFMSQCKFGGNSGPALWIASTSGWQQQYLGNFLYNNFSGKFTVSGISGDELTLSATHDFETGMPVELSAASGATLPTLTRYPSVGLDSHVFWAIKTASNKIKLAYSYEDSLGGTALAITGGSGTYYAWHGAAAGAYLSGGANNNVLSGNRCDQNQNYGIALNKATENVITGNLLNLNGYDSLTGLSESTTSAGVYLRNGSANNVVLGNSMMDWGVYAQTYGVWIDSNNGKNFIGQNAFKANPSQVNSLISSTGNTTETPVIQQVTGATIYADATGSPITIARSDNLNEWKFELSGVTNIMRIKNSYAGNTALNISSPTTDVSLTLGSTGSPLPPRNSLLYGELASTASGANVASGDFYIITGTGTGTNASGGSFRIYTPNTNLTSGTTVHSTSEKFKVLPEGGIAVRTLTAAPSYGLLDGVIYPNSTDSFFYGRLGSAWHTLSNPNKTGVSTVASDGAATFTFSPLVSRWVQVLSTPITATRTVTLSTSFAQQGTEATFVRSSAATGAFNWSIGGLVNLTPGTWATVVYDGSAWVLGPYSTGAGGGGDALTANPLSQFASTTSAQFAGVISDETGTGKVVLDTAPTLSSTVTIGTAGGTTGAANLKGTTSGTVTVSVASAAGTHTIKLPTTDATYAGQSLKSDASGQWGWQNGPGGASSQRYYDEFVWATVGSTTGPWTVNGANVSQVGAQAVNRPGVFQFTTSTTSTGQAYIHNGLTEYVFGGGPVSLEWSARINTAIPDGTETYSTWMGFHDSTSSKDATDGAYFYLDSASGNWQCVTAKASTRTTNSSGVAAVNGTWVKFRIDINAACTSITFYMDGTLVATSTTNLPDTTSNNCAIMFNILKSAGTTARIVQVDYVDLYQSFTTGR